MMALIKKAAKGAAGEAAETVKFLAGVAGVWAVIVTLLFAPFHIPSESMQPSLEVGDRVLVSKWSYGYSRHSLPLGMGYLFPENWNARLFARNPARGDIVVFRSPESRKNIIKRVIGLPGDVVTLRDGRLYINGELVQRDYVETLRYRAHEGPVVEVAVYEEHLPGAAEPHLIFERGDDYRWDNSGPYVVPEGYVFLMGDNRDSSTDSRVAQPMGPGYVRLSEVVGRAQTVIFTLKRCRREEGLHCPSGRVWRGL
ncbi:MAG: signal peptidase I [Maricaulaceae bacterium]|nr:signal peptidase I [Maricaulaceae bacterium]